MENNTVTFRSLLAREVEYTAELEYENNKLQKKKKKCKKQLRLLQLENDSLKHDLSYYHQNLVKTEDYEFLPNLKTEEDMSDFQSLPGLESDSSSTSEDTKILSDNGNFKDMKLEVYGKGYLLKPPPTHPDWGEKYYHDGWWNENRGGWFF